MEEVSGPDDEHGRMRMTFAMVGSEY